jgi:hypothetical protein
MQFKTDRSDSCPTHPLRYAAMALDARAASANHMDSPQDYLRQLAMEDAAISNGIFS